MKPIIGIVGRYEHSSIKVNDEVRMAVIKGGGIPLLILPTQNIKCNTLMSIEEKEDLTKEIKLCDGIIMPGGNKDFEYDRFICEYAIENNIPILGICLGMQIMSYYNAYYSLEENDEGGLNHNQKNLKYVHSITTKKGTILNKILGNNINVNSRHNYHIMKRNGYVVNAISEDGLVEGIENPSNTFNIGVQWHPESMIDYDESEFNLIKKFIEVSNESNNRSN